MSEHTGNTLVVSCGDKRLGATFLATLEEKFGHVYRIQVPGPDAGVTGDAEHLGATMYFVKYFCGAVAFDKIVLIVHEDCAGCRAEANVHEQNVRTLGDLIRSELGFAGAIETYIARRPNTDDFAVWEIDAASDASEEASIAA